MQRTTETSFALVPKPVPALSFVLQIKWRVGPEDQSAAFEGIQSVADSQFLSLQLDAATLPVTLRPAPAAFVTAHEEVEAAIATVVFVLPFVVEMWN